jgi:hypothetical protein
MAGETFHPLALGELAMTALLEVPVDGTQFVDLSSPAGLKFLRRVVTDNGKLPSDSSWVVYARASDGWKLTFWRNVKGQIGDPEARITVCTDYVVRVDGHRGSQVKAFSDCEPVIVREPTGLHLSRDTAGLAAKMLADGGKLSVDCQCGSTNSSRHGLSFYSLSVTLPRFPYATLAIGGDTVCKDGNVLSSGAVDMR